MFTFCFGATVLYIGTLTCNFIVVVTALLQAISWLSIALWPAISLPVLTMFLLLSNFGASICEVANDAIVAEAGKQGPLPQGQASFNRLLGCLALLLVL